MVTASWDGTCRLWDLNTATSSVSYNEHTAQVSRFMNNGRGRGRGVKREGGCLLG